MSYLAIDVQHPVNPFCYLKAIFTSNQYELCLLVSNRTYQLFGCTVCYIFCFFVFGN